jgi:hypothetical protein
MRSLMAWTSKLCEELEPGASLLHRHELCATQYCSVSSDSEMVLEATLI